jgi:multiple sugar transport system substrate-binding protein
MEKFGYWWHGGIIANNPGMIKYAGFAPAPQWGSKRISACFFGTGAWIPQNSKNKAAAWRFMEYFGAGQPAYDRAISGWGLPAVKQYWKDVPHSTPYDKDFNRVQQNELRYLQILHFPPYITNDAMEAALLRYMLPVFKGQTKLEVGAQQLEAAVNKLLQLGKSQVGS